MTQYDQYQSAPPPAAYPTEQQPVYGQPGYQPQRTNTMAILGLVFAFVFSPLGIVFSAIGLKQVKQRREGGRGLALAGLIISIVSLLIGILAVIFWPWPSRGPRSSRPRSERRAVAAGRRPDRRGRRVRVIVPAVVGLESDLATVETPEEYATVMTALRSTMEAAAAQTTDSTFIAHVQTLSGDFQQAVDAVSAGEDPSVPRGGPHRRRHPDRQRLRGRGLRPVVTQHGTSRTTEPQVGPARDRPGVLTAVGDTGFEPVTSSV